MVRQVHRCDGPIHQGPVLPGRYLAGDSQRHQPVHREPGRVMGDCPVQRSDMPPQTTAADLPRPTGSCRGQGSKLPSNRPAL
ncbi:MAG: hypothetical protein OXC96_00300 [Cyanobacteria bacterium MAG CAR1_bin_15]|nr:hypothetical protein [Cyanobacteria bacterium MAG CAR1_bin_15]